MKRFYLICAGLFLLAGTFVLTTAQMQTTQTAQTMSATNTVGKMPKQDKFWAEAAQGGMTEIELSQLALQKSQNEQVKTFAQMMVDDHTKVGDELKALAETKGAMLPTEINPKQMAMKEKLNGLSGDAFDKEYMKMMVKDHDKTVKLFQKQADTGKDADVKAFAAKNLPTIKGHLANARTMSGSMKGKMSDSMNGNMNSGSMNTNSNSLMNSNSSMNSNMTMNSNMSMNSNMMMNGNMQL